MPRTLTLAVAGLAVAAALTGCSGDEPEPAPTAPTAASATPAPTAPTAAGPTSAAAPPATADAQGLCGFLEAETPRLQQAGPGAAARSLFTGDIGLWTMGGQGRQMTDATALDTLATRECPDVRTRLLAVLQTDSLNAALG